MFGLFGWLLFLERINFIYSSSQTPKCAYSIFHIPLFPVPIFPIAISQLPAYAMSTRNVDSIHIFGGHHRNLWETWVRVYHINIWMMNESDWINSDVTYLQIGHREHSHGWGDLQWRNHAVQHQWFANFGKPVEKTEVRHAIQLLEYCSMKVHILTWTRANT